MTADIHQSGSSHLDRLIETIRHEGSVVRHPDGVIGIFDPVIASQVEAANTEALFVGRSLVDLLTPARTRAHVPWSDVRSALVAQNRRLSEPRHLKVLHERMRVSLLEHVDQETDLTWLIGRAVTDALVPHIIDGLSEPDLRLLQVHQESRIRTILAEQPSSIPLRLSGFVRLRRVTRVISREVRRRVEGRAPPREDFLEALLPFVERIGTHRVTYLVTTLLAAASVAPEFSAACLVYAMHRHPEWQEKITQEMAELGPEDLYRLPMERLPSTLRFMKEVARMWPFPFIVRRTAARDISVDGAELRKGERYDVSLYVLHHLDTHWDDPDRFDPDRWLSPRKAATKGSYAPFGFAPRSCVGGAVGNAVLLLVCELFTRSLTVEMAAKASPRLKMDGLAVPTGMIGSVRRAVAS